MAEVWPFAGTRYATKEHGIALGEAIAPPFDDINPALQKELHERNPRNVVRLTYGYEAPSDDDNNNRYSRSAECYREWKAAGFLADEHRKCFYVYEQEFVPPGGTEPVKRLGFFALVKLQDFRSGKTRAFEMTHEAPKADRLRLLRTMQVNDSPLYMLYRDENGSVDTVLREALAKTPPEEEFTSPDGMVHRLWLMHKKDPILRIHEAMKPLRLFIAHGHHRYETALKYRDEMREMTGRRDGRQPYDFVLMFLQRAEEDTLYTNAIHRVLARELGLDIEIDEVIEDLGEFFTLTEFKVNMKDIDKGEHQVLDKLRLTRGAKTRFVMCLPSGRAWQLTLKKDADLAEMIDEETMSDRLKQMDPVVLHHYIIARGWIGNPEVELDEDDIFYRKDISAGLDLLKRRKGCVGFFMNPLSKVDVLEVAENGELLPHSSVDFHPKIPSGLVLRDLNVGFG
ncbi:MAG: DUF1015 domain-containing protein [Candidatus Sumerlaeia bacterium]|nr:DUF1015 domain-containing protein [Candidatus Sumerlaeia bacterium]